MRHPPEGTRFVVLVKHPPDVKGVDTMCMEESSGTKVPCSLVASGPGLYEEKVAMLCRACATGSGSIGGARAKHQRYTFGSMANAKSGALHAALQRSLEVDCTSCAPCLAGTVAAGTRRRNCNECPTGSYQGSAGQSACELREAEITLQRLVAKHVPNVSWNM